MPSDQTDLLLSLATEANTFKIPWHLFNLTRDALRDRTGMKPMDTNCKQLRLSSIKTMNPPVH